MILNNKIDFAIVISACGCNPNGDPLQGGRPRTNMDGYGEISDVCLKRKIRNRLQDMGYNIFMQADDRADDGFRSMKERFDNSGELAAEAIKNKNKSLDRCIRLSSEKWIDVRAFGQVFPFKGDSVSFSVRGPCSITMARSVDIVDVIDIKITKSLNIENSEKNVKDSGTLGNKYIINKGAYVAYGSIFPQLALKTGFSEEDSEAIHECLKTLFENDASAARPSGSINVSKVIWWKHPSPNGRYASGSVFRSLKFSPLDEYPFYTLEILPFEGLKPEVYTEF